MEGNDVISNLNSGETSSEVIRRGWDPGNEVLIGSSQCADTQCLKGPSFSETLINTLLYVCGTTFVLCLIILLIYFIIYKHKKNSNPLKHALKKAGIGGIIIFIIQIILIVLACIFG